MIRNIKKVALAASVLMFGLTDLSASGQAHLRPGIENLQEQYNDKGNSFRVLSYNICSSFFDGRDETEDKRHHWENRKAALVNLINKIAPDIIGWQELSPQQAIDVSELFSNYTSKVLVQHPFDEDTTGKITKASDAKKWLDVNIGTFLMGFSVNSEKFDISEEGRFWLNSDPETVPLSSSYIRGESDQGFGNKAAFRAVFWLKLSDKKTKKELFVFNSHYPFNGDSNTRLGCARVEREMIDKITKGKPWVSMGDRNFIPNVAKLFKNEKQVEISEKDAYNVLVRGAYDVRGFGDHFGSATTWAGYNYDKFRNKVAKGEFLEKKVLDVMVFGGSLECNQSMHIIGEYSKKDSSIITITGKVKNPGMYYVSDHFGVAADLLFN